MKIYMYNTIDSLFLSIKLDMSCKKILTVYLVKNTVLLKQQI
jgi:hypothetical protein